MSKSYSREITDAQVMLSGIKANQDALAKRQINDNFATKLQSAIEICISLNNEQEKLKAYLKRKTEELNEQIQEIKSKTNEAKKIIKLDIPQSLWKEFGITDKK